MDNVISFELTQKLNELSLLDSVNTEFVYHNIKLDYLGMDDEASVIWTSNEISLEDIDSAKEYKKEFERLKDYYSSDLDTINQFILKQQEEFKSFNISFDEQNHEKEFKDSFKKMKDRYSESLIFYKTLTLEEFKELIKNKVPEEIIENYFSDNLTAFYFNIKDAEEMLTYLLENKILK